VWLRLYSLPQEFWLEEVLAGIGNTIGVYVKSSEATKQQRYTSYARICVYLNIAKPLPGSIALEYQDEDWMQTIDYEHILFRCRKCHEHGHLFRDCPLNTPSKEGNPEANKDKDGFIPTTGKHRQGGRRPTTQPNKEPTTSNQFEILQQQPECMDASQAPSTEKTPQNPEKGKEKEAPGQTQIIPPPSSTAAALEPSETKDGDTEMELDEKDLAGVDLEHLEHAYRHHKIYTIPPDQLRKVHKIFLNSSAGSTARSSAGLGIQGNTQKEQHKSQKDEKKRGRKSTSKLIQEIGHFMVNSGQIHLISDSFPPLPSPSSS
jgi:hypothetical protein